MNRVLSLLFLVPAFFMSPLWAQTSRSSLSPSELSHTIEKSVQDNGFYAMAQELSQTAGSSFPFNILIEFPDSNQTLQKENQRNQLFLLITQEDFYEHADSFLSFFGHLQDLEKSCSVTVVLTACDSVPLMFSGGIFGSRVFAESIEDTDSCSALAITFGEKNTLYTNFPRTTPRQMFEAIDASFRKNNTIYSFPQWITSLYRLNLVRMHTQLSPLISQGVPVAKIEFDSPENLKIVESFISNFNLSNTINWESHYLAVHIPTLMRTLFISERVFVILTLVMGTLSLLFLYSFTFIGKERLKQKKEFRSTWYVLPLTYLISLAGLMITQKITFLIPVLRYASPLFQSGIKIIVSTFFVSVFFVILQFLNKSVSSIIYGYIILIVSVSNIFLFTAVDLLFFIPMMIEYIIIYLSRKAFTFGSLIASLIFMMLPFAPYLYILIAEAQASSYLQFLYGSLRITVLIAFLLFPFQIILLKVLMRFHTLSQEKRTVKETVISNAISIGSALGLLTAVIVILYFTTIRVQSKDAMPHYRINPSQEDLLSYETSKTTFASLTTMHLSLHSKRKAVCYSVLVQGRDAIPIFDSSFDYSSNEQTKTVTFAIPPYPAKDITIDFASNDSTDLFVTISAVYETGDADVFIKETETCTIEKSETKGGVK